MHKVYVTGSSGMLGYALAGHFAACPETRVQAIARSPLPSETRPGFDFEQNASLYDADWYFPGDSDATLIHCAGLSNPRSAFNSFSTLATGHILPHVEMLESMLERGWRGRLIYPSSGGAVYGEVDELPIREEHPGSPKGFYGLQKLCLEQILNFMADRHGFELVILRVANPYGSLVRKTTQGVIPILIRAYLEGSRFRVFGDGTAERDYIHIDDVCTAFAAAARTALPERRLTLNIGSGQGVAINDLIAMIGGLLGRELDREYIPVEVDVRSNILCNARARERLGWRPQIPFAEGMERLVSRMRADIGV